MLRLSRDSEFKAGEHVSVFKDDKHDLTVEWIIVPMETVLRYAQVNKVVVPLRRVILPREVLPFPGALAWSATRGFRVAVGATLRVICNLPFTCHLAVELHPTELAVGSQRMRSVGRR